VNKTAIVEQIRKKQTFLCVGIDPDPDKMPDHLFEENEPLYDFAREIVDATADHCVAYKMNTAFYEAAGISGIESLEKTIRYVKANYPDHLVIADAKRADIGNTSEKYAKAFFMRLGADAITVSPYMGRDSLEPFFAFKGKWTIILGITSNPGASDFQELKVGGRELYLEVMQKCAEWGSAENTMFVAGATRASKLEEIRKMLPDHFLLIPGVGAQGGNLQEVYKYGSNTEVGLLVNLSRSIIYASGGMDFASRAGEEARSISSQMALLLK
jgi:orotidine-5'-phosphate decarboxylase